IRDSTSDALMSGGVFGMVGAIERMHRQIVAQCGEAPALYMTGGAAIKLAPVSDLPFELIDTLIFEGLLTLAAERRRNGL
ncbi:MAG: type III pantothenate kinase, partial [Leptothrix sp. (in: b-proteobacteria)]